MNVIRRKSGNAYRNCAKRRACTPAAQQMTRAQLGLDVLDGFPKFIHKPEGFSDPIYMSRDCVCGLLPIEETARTVGDLMIGEFQVKGGNLGGDGRTFQPFDEFLR